MKYTIVHERIVVPSTSVALPERELLKIWKVDYKLHHGVLIDLIMCMCIVIRIIITYVNIVITKDGNVCMYVFSIVFRC
jgi:hypothetical protein